MGANAVLMMRYDSAEIGNTMSEIVAYGTAAVIEPNSVMGFLFPRGFFVAVILFRFLFRSGGYKRQPLDAPPGERLEFHRRAVRRSQIGRDDRSLVLP